MNRYKVRVYMASGWSMFTQADHFEDYYMETSESLEQIALRLMTRGFKTDSGRKWIMPASILTVEVEA